MGMEGQGALIHLKTSYSRGKNQMTETKAIYVYICIEMNERYLQIYIIQTVIATRYQS